MKHLPRSFRVYLVLMVTLITLTVINVFLPQGQFSSLLHETKLPASKTVIAIASAGITFVLYGGLGLIGLVLSQKLGIPDLLDDRICHKQRFIVPVFIGVGPGIFFIVIDALVRRLHALGTLRHPAFPASLISSATAGIGEEIIFRSMKHFHSLPLHFGNDTVFW